MGIELDRPQRLAILIDAENASPRATAAIFEEIATIGEASVRRIYGDFSSPRLKGWSEVLATYAIIPQQNFANTVGKNASDIALVIDAMDLLHSSKFDGFCLISGRVRQCGVELGVASGLHFQAALGVICSGCASSIIGVARAAMPSICM